MEEDWKFGDVISFPGMTLRIMLVARSDGRLVTTDHYHSSVPAGGWLGLNIARDVEQEPDSGPYGEPGETTWVIGNSSDGEWITFDE